MLAFGSAAALVAVSAPDWAAKMAALATLVLAIAAVIALASLGDARRARHAQIILDLSRRWDEPIATESRELEGDYDVAGILSLIESVYKPPAGATVAAQKAGVAVFFKLQASLNLMETIGVLYAEDAISGRVIFRLWGASIVQTWDRWDQPIRRMRDLEKRLGIYRYFELLARDMKERLTAEATGSY